MVGDGRCGGACMMAVVVWGGAKMVVKGEGAHSVLCRASDEPWYGALGMVVSALRNDENEVVSSAADDPAWGVP